jgi:hypothetical protein
MEEAPKEGSDAATPIATPLHSQGKADATSPLASTFPARMSGRPQWPVK